MYSPKGRWVEELEGDSAAIRRRGNQITRLGGQMSHSASFLQSLAGQADGMKGEAVDKLREVVGDSYKQLGQAADLYAPTGPILVDYADELSGFQTIIRTRVQDCNDAKSGYDDAPGYREGARPFWAQPAPWRSDEEKEQMGDQNDVDDRAKERLHEAYQDALKAFDHDVDSWEEVFDSTAGKIEDGFKGKIKDGFWDNVDGVVSVIVTVLQYAGMVIAIAAIIIGGPIIGAIAAVVAVATLALVAYQFFRGDASGWDLALAVVAVIPFGSLGKFAQGKSGVVSILGDTFKAFKPSTYSAAAGQLRNMSMASHFAGGGFKGFLQGGRTMWELSNPKGIGDIVSRLMLGKDTTKLSELAESMAAGGRGWQASSIVPGAWEFTHTVLYAPVTTIDNVMKLTGNQDKALTTQYPWLKVFK
ncbi:hypothetical protein [Microbacterium sp. NPDC057650]|uniref:hypothetical protein n=1 Tax=unclassified Microbacterium TaxID=2609290 RepID=UPI00366C4ED9